MTLTGILRAAAGVTDVKWTPTQINLWREEWNKETARRSHSTPAQQRAWRAKNREHVRATQKAYRESRRDLYVKASKDWRARNPEKLTAAQRRRTLKKYGITEDDYQRLLAAQGGGCAICGERPPLRKTRSGRRYERLDIDHDHQTGKVRGLLCCNCNAILGHAGDDVDVLSRAIGYVENHR